MQQPITFIYDPSGNRTIQITGDIGNPGTAGLVFEYYVYDASGNVLSTYTRTVVGVDDFEENHHYTDELVLNDRNIYGASRLGTKKENKKMADRNFFV